MHFHGIVTPRIWGIAIQLSWYQDTKELAIQFGPFNVFLVIGDK